MTSSSFPYDEYNKNNDEPRREVTNPEFFKMKREAQEQAARDEDVQDIMGATTTTVDELEKLNANMDKLTSEVQSIRKDVESIADMMREYLQKNKQ